MLVNCEKILLQVYGLLLLLSACYVSGQQVLEEFSCDFVSPCCWHPQGNLSSVLIHAEPIDKRWYAKTFRVEVAVDHLNPLI
uniref:Uncharacterized protein n=1 Tax=Ditylenchus dipsaci TaxID=166011 RepID=A0A915DE92_9BILA